MLTPDSKIGSTTTVALSLLGFILGILIGTGVLSGDSQGRVNLLLLLLLFAFLPAISLVLSAMLGFFNINGVTAAIMNSPFWPRQLQLAQLQIGTGKPRRMWLFFQSQVFALAFATGSLVIFLILLLGTDINFVWRSTLLEATDLQPVLSLIALPWLYWQDAQPSLALLEQSQNSRMAGGPGSYSENWWQFVLAAQLSYNLMPRAVFLLFAGWQYRIALSKELTDSSYSKAAASPQPQEIKPELSGIVYTLGSRYSLLDWGGAPEHCQRFITSSFGKPVSYLKVSPLESLPGLPEQESLVVLVKSWDAPLAELGDLLATSSPSVEHYLLPLDWNDSSITQPLASHLEEWQRFAATLPNWKVLQPGEHS